MARMNSGWGRWLERKYSFDVLPARGGPRTAVGEGPRRVGLDQALVLRIADAQVAPGKGARKACSLSTWCSRNSLLRPNFPSSEERSAAGLARALVAVRTGRVPRLASLMEVARGRHAAVGRRS